MRIHAGMVGAAALILAAAGPADAGALAEIYRLAQEHDAQFASAEAAVRAAERPSGELADLEERLDKLQQTEKWAKARLDVLSKEGVPKARPAVEEEATAVEAAIERVGSLRDAGRLLSERHKAFKGAADSADQKRTEAENARAAADLPIFYENKKKYQREIPGAVLSFTFLTFLRGDNKNITNNMFK